MCVYIFVGLCCCDVRILFVVLFSGDMLPRFFSFFFRGVFLWRCVVVMYVCYLFLFGGWICVDVMFFCGYVWL